MATDAQAAATGARSSFRGVHARPRRWLDDYALFQALRVAPLAAAVVGMAGAARTPRPDRRCASAEGVSRRRSTTGSTCSGSRRSSGRGARRACRPLQVFGDVPFMISADSPDVWTRQREFRFDATVGVPPDAFSETGQDWGLPPWRWDVMARERLRVDAAARARAPRSCSTASGSITSSACIAPTSARSDKSVTPFFAPPDEADAARARRNARRRSTRTAAPRSSRKISAPCPTSSARRCSGCSVPGFKVMRWERHWAAPGHPFIDPAEYHEMSVATTGTHDTEPLVSWWEIAGCQAGTSRDPAAARRCSAILRRRRHRSRRCSARCSTRHRGSRSSPSRILRLARSHQHAGAGQRRQLDVAAAVAGRPAAAKWLTHARRAETRWRSGRSHRGAAIRQR